VNIILGILFLFFLIQFSMILTVMVVALLLAGPEVPLLGRESKHRALAQRLASVIALLRRRFWSAVSVAGFVGMNLRLCVHRVGNGNGRPLDFLHSPTPRWPRDPRWGHSDVRSHGGYILGNAHDPQWLPPVPRSTHLTGGRVN